MRRAGPRRTYLHAHEPRRSPDTPLIMLQRLLPTIAVALPSSPAPSRPTRTTTPLASPRSLVASAERRFDLAAGEPSCVYGTVLDGEARLHVPVSPTTCSGTVCSSTTRSTARPRCRARRSARIHLSFKDFTVRRLRSDARGGEIAGGTTSINGAEVDAGQWLFVVDANDPEAARSPWTRRRPSSPGASRSSATRPARSCASSARRRRGESAARRPWRHAGAFATHIAGPSGPPELRRMEAVDERRAIVRGIDLVYRVLRRSAP